MFTIVQKCTELYIYILLYIILHTEIACEYGKCSQSSLKLDSLFKIPMFHKSWCPIHGGTPNRLSVFPHEIIGVYPPMSCQGLVNGIGVEVSRVARDKSKNAVTGLHGRTTKYRDLYQYFYTNVLYQCFIPMFFTNVLYCSFLRSL